MSLALYRKYRSKSLKEIVGQSHITDVLTRALEQGRIAHAYLLTGPRGVGKTSIARILAHEINSLPYEEGATHLDIIEIDAASNNGVEDVRDLRDKVQLAPVSASKKVYIIDEVHMLSKPAFNALLKTLEEPPAHVVFILATTDVEKLPDTIVSRTQRYSFRSIAPSDAVRHLKAIAKEEGIAISDEALELIAERGDGSFRDSISLLDQLANLSGGKDPISVTLIEETLGLAPASVVDTLITRVVDGDIPGIALAIKDARDSGINPVTLTGQLTHALRERVIEQPELLSLLDALLDVGKSSHPELKLLSVLGNAAAHAKQPPKSAALLATIPEVTATIAELSQPPKKTQKPTDTPPAPTPSPAKKTRRQTPSSFDWQQLVAHIREHHVALYSVLGKCAYEFDGATLTLYTGTNFAKKRIDDSKYRSILAASCDEVFGFQPTIHTVPTPPPLKDSQAASVAAIMGGGEEVSLETA